VADVDREYIPQYGTDAIGVVVAVSGTPTDVDANAVSVTVQNEDSQATLFSRSAVHAGVGEYQVGLTPDDTATLGNFVATWTYQLSGSEKVFRSYFAIGGAQPYYDNLTDDLKAIVDGVWVRFADMFDSPNGGPNLQTYFQTNWNRGRVAQLLRMAVGRLNTAAQPWSNYSIDPGGKQFPTAQWGALLEQATYVEALKHLRRSYLEQPAYEGSSISRLDRRDYFDRWGIVLADEEALMRPQLDAFKIKAMGLGRPAILVSGGIFGRYSPVNMPGMAGRPRLWYANYG
jgi:hypothetical protein